VIKEEALKMAVDQEKMLEQLGEMTVLELSEFIDAFKEKFNVTAVAAAAAVAPGAVGAAEAAEEEKDEFDVVLESIGNKKIQVIKVVRELTTLGAEVVGATLFPLHHLENWAQPGYPGAPCGARGIRACSY
jgi:ribosomal protein L7/L12